jgi:protein SCO1
MRALLLLITLVPLAAACGGATAQSPTVTAAEPAAFRGSAIVPPRAAPEFALDDQAGRKVDLDSERGRIVLITFLYTHCPDVCPLIAQNLNEALRRLGQEQDNVRVLAVSVDPQGDTPASVRRFVRQHRLLAQFRYLTGSRSELMAIWKAWDVAAVARSPELVDHTAYTALIDQEGRERAVYDSQVRAADVVHDVRLLLKEGNG